eukprot:TRINITY_DN1429_c0_g2_i2.p1 TRINITY_DN1429_c0_g2~~TRINITY_DN1429_c0_g2_i2.p1  ORF type:complete len:1019 (-),score=197.62 TRINITY_DN1429_c0_g2_i2:2357-5413(-)
MFESAAAAILNRLLGQIIEEFNTDQIRTGYDVIFEKANLKRDALASIGFPIEIRRGCVGRLHLEIPWLSLLTDPIVITLEDVYAILSPAIDIASSVDVEAQFRAKMAEVAAMEGRRIALKEKHSDAGRSDWMPSNLVQRVLGRAINNVQIRMKNIHVRFEETGQTQQPIALGLSLDQLNVFTTNSDWQSNDANPTKSETDDKFIFKVASLENLSVYCDPLSNVIAEELSDADFVQYMIDLIATRTDSAEHTFLLAPLMASLKLRFNSAIGDFSCPKVDASLLLPDLGLAVHNRQIRGMLRAVDFLMSMSNGKEHKDSRPRMSPLVDARAWWQWAMACISRSYQERRKRRRLDYITKRRGQRLRYMELHRKRLESGGLRGGDAGEMEQLERELDARDILFFRALTAAALKHDLGLDGKQQVQAKRPSFWQWILGRTPTNTDITARKRGAAAQPAWKVGEAERQRFYEALGYNKDEEPPHGPPEYVRIKFEVVLPKAGVVVRSDAPSEPVLRLNVQDLRALVSIRELGLTVNASLHDAVVTDPLGSEPHCKVLCKTAGAEKLPLLTIGFEVNPVAGAAAAHHADFALTLRTVPVDCIITAPFIGRMQAFALAAKPGSVGTLQKAMFDTIDDTRHAIQQMLDEALLASRQPRIYIDAFIGAPIIVLPKHSDRSDSDALVVRLWDIEMKSCPPTPGVDGGEFDCWTIKLSTLNAFIAPSTCAHRQLTGQQKLIDDVTIVATLENCLTLHPEDPRLRCVASLEQLHLNLSMEHMRTVLAISDCFATDLIKTSTAAEQMQILPAPVEPAVAEMAKFNEFPQPDREADVHEPWDDISQSVSGPGKTSEVAMFKLFHVDLSVNRIGILLSHESERVLEVAMTSLRTLLRTRQYDITVDFSVESLAMRDCQTDAGRPSDVLVAGSEVQPDTALIKGTVQLTDTLSPEFNARGRVMMAVDVSLAPVVISLHPLFVSALFKFATDCVCDAELLMFRSKLKQRQWLFRYIRCLFRRCLSLRLTVFVMPSY